MALHFSANQYDQAFTPHILQNWEVPCQYRPRPRAFDGFTQPIANDRGHLLEGVKRCRDSPWGTFVGTWDMPLTIPGNTMTNTCARDEVAIQKLERIKTDGEIVLSGKLKQSKVPSPLPVKADAQTTQFISQTQVTQTGSGYRSGARNPEPGYDAAVRSPQPVLYSEKPGTPMSPNLVWPQPASRAASRAKSATPRLASQPRSPHDRMAQQVLASPFRTATPKAFTTPPPNRASPMPGTPSGGRQAMTPSRASIHWPAPKSVEPPKQYY